MVDEETKLLVWQKCKTLTNLDPAMYRIGRFGGLMKWDEYENRDSNLGWEIDQRFPEKGDRLCNLDALQWEDLVNKGERALDSLVASIAAYQRDEPPVDPAEADFEAVANVP